MFSIRQSYFLQPCRRIKWRPVRLLIPLLLIAFIIHLLSKRPKEVISVELLNNEEVVADNYLTYATLSAIYIRKFDRLNPVVKGWGENGSPVELTDPKEKKAASILFKKGAFNVYVSDRISPNRSLPEPRPKECNSVKYNIKSLGTCSIVIIFTNEIWSALIRTIWSTWNRTPPDLLKEIILVDDDSSRSDLKDDLEVYCEHYFGDKVKIIRLPEREGLIRARITGAKAATGDVIVFLDSHCEVTKGWLEPLMKTIKNDPSNVVCPVIDVISDKNLEYCSGSPYFFQIGSFTWSGHFTWIDIPEEQMRLNPTMPLPSPTMAGGLFAINRNYFFSIGSYDDKMEIWGGENLELSFRIWQCGGKLLIHPCSHVGHIFRDYHPYSFQGKDTHGINTLRTVLVWMDKEYQKYFFMHRSDLLNTDPGDLTERFELKKNLRCKSFKWYLDTVFEGKKFMYDKNAKAWGSIRNPKTNLCLDTLNADETKPNTLSLFVCLPIIENVYTNQYFTLTNNGELRRDESCVQIDDENHMVKLDKCLEVNKLTKRARIVGRHEKNKQLWTQNQYKQIINLATRECLTTNNVESGMPVRLEPCNNNDLLQKWWFQKYSF